MVMAKPVRELNEKPCTVGHLFLCPLPLPGLVLSNSFEPCFQRPRPKLSASRSFRLMQNESFSGCRCPIGPANLQVSCMEESAWFSQKPLPVCMPAGISICRAPFRWVLKLAEATSDPPPTVTSWRKQVSFVALPSWQSTRLKSSTKSLVACFASRG
jgi:hypothetical protein